MPMPTPPIAKSGSASAVTAVSRLIAVAAWAASCAASAQTDAATGASPLPVAVVSQALTLAEQTALSVAPAGARVEVVAGTLDARLRLAPCSRIDAFPAPGAAAWGRTRVGLRCSDGASAWRVFLPLTVRVLAQAVVSTTALAAGTMLDASQLTLAEADWADGQGSASADPALLVGRQLTRALRVGQVLRSSDLRPRRHFELGDTVRVEAAGDGFNVVAEGLALTPGLEGQPARVRVDNGRVLVGRPVGDNRIEVRM